jgi:DNA polymerase III subunit epsilon
MADLSRDPAFLATTFIVIDFEGTTPRGHPPEPIEVAALALRTDGQAWTETGRFEALICPPPHAPITGADISQTGITAAMVAGQPGARVVLADLDQHMSRPPCLLVAHHAPTEAGFLYRYRDACPGLAGTGLLDTIRIARQVMPGLPAYNLDELVARLAIPLPAGRHRAMPDVQITARLFTTLLGREPGLWADLRALTTQCGLTARASQPVQEALF